MLRLFFEMYRTPSARTPRRTQAIFRMCRAKKVVNSSRGREGHGRMRSARYCFSQNFSQSTSSSASGLSKSICIPSPCARGFS